MLPADLALPVKFTDWRKGQLDTVIAAAVSEKRFYLLSMPTGGGKSAVYMALAQMLGVRTLVLTGTKGLQDQLMADFRAMGLVEIRGQNNYRCELESPGNTHPRVTCDEGPCHAGVLCEFRNRGCEYYDKVRVAGAARLVVTNYTYWMTVNRYSDPEQLGEFGLIILDEAHDAPEQLANFCAIEIDKGELSSLLEMELPPLNEGQEIWAEWALNARATCISRLAAAKARLHEGAKYVKLVRRLGSLGRSLEELAKSAQWRRGEPSYPNATVPGMATDWVGEEIVDPEARTKVKGARFSPVWAHAYAEQYLFKRIPRVLLASATLQPKAAKYLGIGPDEYEFKETPSTFDPVKRPLIWIPTTTVDRNMSTGQERVWLNRIDAIVGARLDRKGIIHTRSYDRAKVILAESRHKRFMVGHTSRTARDVVSSFKRSTRPLVLVSPSMETGWDFPYDQCEYQIIAKVPFLDTRSRVLQARIKSDKKFSNYMTVLSIIQQYGRGMRAEDDSCETFIVDDNIEWFWPAAKEFWPKWVKAAYRKQIWPIPEPLPKQRRHASEPVAFYLNRA